MEAETDVGVYSEATGQQLNRNRSFKSKQLVRSQAIRESTSPPRTVSPSVRSNGDNTVIDNSNNVIDNSNNAIDNLERYSDPTVIETSDAVNSVITVINRNNVANNVTRNVTRTVDRHSDESSHVDVICSSDDKKMQTVEIQITAESVWDGDVCPMQRQNKQWQNDLLSHSPRITCVCEPQRRPIIRKTMCCSKQDSGISCSDDVPDDAPTDGSNNSCSCEKEDEVEGTELVNFLKETLNKNPRDRTTLLNIEKDLHSLVMDPGRCIARFSGMSSYGRMLVHRAASLFRLNHHHDNHNHNLAVRVTKTGTSGGRIPCTSFQQWCTTVFPPSPTKAQDTTHAKSILKRDAHSLDETGSLSRSNSRSKSLEQREKEYERVRRRIFSSDNCNQDESQWPWLNSGPVKLLTPDSGKNKLLKVHSLETDVPCPTTRGAVSKSHSFGGYGRTKQHRILSRQGDLASSSWRLSPSSSGYKTLSLRSTDSVTPSPTGNSVDGGASPELSVSGGNPSWPPVAAVVIHPQTGRPLTNPDGSIYQFDPANPPYLYDANAFIQHQMEENIDKRRDRLEKQDSFVGRADFDCTVDDRKQNSRRVDTSQQTQQQQLDKTNTETTVEAQKSPIKKAPEIKTTATPEPPTNERRASETPTNQKPDITIQTQPPYETPYETPYEPRHTNNNGGYANQYKNQFSYEKEPANQKPAVEFSANHRPQKDEVPQYVAHNNYVHSYRNDEVQSPQVIPHTFIQPDMMSGMNLHGLGMHKIPIIQDPNIRTIPMANILYQQPIHQPYQYINQCRIDQPMQPIYQPMLPTEEHKQLPASPHPAEGTFRIDPSYPYAAVDYSQCGSCVDTTMQPQHRSYNMSVGGVEVPVLPVQQPCPVTNVMLPQPHLQHYPMSEMQWVPRTVQRRTDCPCPGAPALVPPYIIYPSMVPQPYQICQPIYPTTDEAAQHNSSNRQSKLNSLANSARSTPHSEVKRETADRERERRDPEIAAKIQQIKDQMAKLNTRSGYVPPTREDWRRNSGSGILGSHPHQLNGAAAGNAWEEEVPMTPEATAIYNILRMRHKNNTYRPRAPRTGPARPPRPHPAPRARHDRPDHAQYAQMAPGTWCTRSPAPLHPGFNQPRRPYPEPRNGRR